MVDPFGRAIRDYYLDELDEPLLHRDGEQVREHPIERFYFGEFAIENERDDWLASWLDGPLLDMGAGVGRHALYFQDEFETVAIDVSRPLVKAMRERGVKNARHADMFALREAFERDRFRSALAHGTQVGLARSEHGLRRFLGDLAYVTTPDASAVLDCYDPELVATRNLLGYREDPAPGLAYRVMHFQYEGEIGDTLLFRLFSPERLRDATVGTDWEVEDVKHVPAENPNRWEAALTKR